MKDKTKTMFKRLVVGASGFALIAGLGCSPKDNTVIARDWTLSGDVTYRQDSSGNITAILVPSARQGWGGVTKYNVSRDSKKYQELTNIGEDRK